MNGAGDGNGEGSCMQGLCRGAADTMPFSGDTASQPLHSIPAPRLSGPGSHGGGSPGGSPPAQQSTAPQPGPGLTAPPQGIAVPLGCWASAGVNNETWAHTAAAFMDQASCCPRIITQPSG